MITTHPAKSTPCFASNDGYTDLMDEQTEQEATKRKKCKHGQHTDRLVRGGKRLECTTCGDSFPCLNVDCGHFDCQWERDEPGAAIAGELGFVVD